MQAIATESDPARRRKLSFVVTTLGSKKGTVNKKGTTKNRGLTSAEVRLPNCASFLDLKLRVVPQRV